MNQGGFAPILLLIGILIIVLVGGGIYYYQAQIYRSATPTSQVSKTPRPSTQTDETANWKTYINPVIKYTFEYPPDWKLTEQNLGPATIANLDSPNSTVSIAVSATRWFDPGGCGAPCPKPPTVTFTIKGKKYTAIEDAKPNSTSGKVGVALLNPDFLPAGAILINTTSAELQKNMDVIQKILNTIEVDSATGN